MVARQQPFESFAAKALLVDFKEKTPELYRFLRAYYEKKHAQCGEQFLSFQTTITIDC